MWIPLSLNKFSGRVADYACRFQHHREIPKMKKVTAAVFCLNRCISSKLNSGFVFEGILFSWPSLMCLDFDFFHKKLTTWTMNAYWYVYSFTSPSHRLCEYTRAKVTGHFECFSFHIFGSGYLFWWHWERQVADNQMTVYLWNQGLKGLKALALLPLNSFLCSERHYQQSSLFRNGG